MRYISSIGKEIREIARKKGGTLYRISKDLGIPNESLLRSLKEDANPDWKTIKKLLDYLGYEIRLVKKKRKRSKYFQSLFLILTVLLVFFAASSARDLATVRRVVDGDTLVLVSGEKVRLIGVDTPETKHPKKPVQYFGREACQFTSRMLQGKKVVLEYDWQRRDRYGRLLAYVYLSDGTFLNAKIIKEGYGFANTRYRFKYLDQFKSYEKEAREKGNGLWKHILGFSSTKTDQPDSLCILFLSENPGTED